MKLLTLNTHSLIEDNYENKLKFFINAIYDIKPDIIALQEVNQTRGKISDNHAFRIYKMLKAQGLHYFCEWLPIKCGYEIFDEGIAILTLSPIIKKNEILLSEFDDYYDWRTRKALGVQIDTEWFYSVHFGWWQDKSDPFKKQWERFEDGLQNDKAIWVLGDLNNPASIHGEGYDYITSRGWYDTYAMAAEKDDGITVSGEIAGWQNNTDDKRIDYIFTNKKQRILSSEVIFNGKNKEIVSDHFGILVTL